MNQYLWSDLASIATIISAIVVIGAALLAVQQLREMSKARYLEGMLRVYDLIASEDARASRRFIYGELTSKPEAITAKEQEKVETVSVLLDRVGALVSAGLVPKDLLLASHHDMFIRSWDKLAPYIFYRRLHGDASYVIHFEQVADMARNFQAERAAKCDKALTMLSDRRAGMIR